MDDPQWLKIGIGGVVPIAWDLAAKDSQDPGMLEGWASVYNVVDEQDEIVLPGAFTKTLNDWRASKRVIPLTLDHENRARGVIGSLANVVDTQYGLKTTFRFSSDPDAQSARTKAKEGHLTGLSIFGPIVKAIDDVRAGRPVRLLAELGLWFVGLTPLGANAKALVTTAKAVTDAAWDGSSARFSLEQWRASCLIDTGQGETSEFGRYKVPVKEPNGDVNRNAVHTAAGGHGLMAVEGISDDTRRAAARKLVAMYRNDLKEDPPEGMLRMAGMASASLPESWVGDMKSALSITVPAARKAAVDLLVDARYGLGLAVPDVALGPAAPAVVDAPQYDPQSPARYALELIGESGPSASSPGGEPSRSLADLMASGEGARLSVDLDALAKEIERENTGG